MVFFGFVPKDLYDEALLDIRRQGEALGRLKEMLGQQDLLTEIRDLIRERDDATVSLTRMVSQGLAAELMKENESLLVFLHSLAEQTGDLMDFIERVVKNDTRLRVRAADVARMTVLFSALERLLESDQARAFLNEPRPFWTVGTVEELMQATTGEEEEEEDAPQEQEQRVVPIAGETEKEGVPAHG